MMKKFLMLIVALVACISINAQTALQTTKVLDNTYIGINAGASTPLSFNSVFPVNGMFGVKVGKNFTPVFGLNVEGNTWFGSNTDPQTRFDYFNRTAEVGKEYLVKQHNTFRAVNTGLNGTINLTNLFLGYNGDFRCFELSTVTGIGWLHTFKAHASDVDNFSAKTGLDFTFNMKHGNAIYVEPTIYWNLTEGTGVKFNKNNAQLALAVGYVYNFKTSNKTHNFKLFDITAMNNEINSLKEKLAAKPAVERIVENKETVIDNSFDVVFFAQNSAVLSPEAKETLNSIKNTPVEIIGYASPEGTQEYNKDLSYKRAKAVADYLANEGFTIKSCVGAGCENDTSNRVVIIKK